MKKILLIALLAFAPLGALALEPLVDLGISDRDIFFSHEGDLVAGDHIRLYAKIHNLGEVDVEGYVEFFQGSIPIGQSQVISVRAGGVPEEVFVDFIVPSGSFNIRADIKGTDPQDENAGNNSALTKLYSPIFDDDRDGVPNDQDNCPSQANQDQADADNDGLGDVCDDDDDNDGISDDVENEIGSSPLVADTDEDGVEDPGDAYPADPKQSGLPSTLEELLANTADEIMPSLDAEAAAAEDYSDTLEAAGTQVEINNQEFSPKAVFSYSRVDWNKFQFKAITPETAGYRFEWDFDDGVTSNRHSPEHEYASYGNFKVSLRIIAPGGEVSEDTTVVSVPFFTMHNSYVLMIIGLLSLLLLFGLVFTAKMSILPKRQENKPEPVVESPIVVPENELESTSSASHLEEAANNEVPLKNNPSLLNSDNRPAIKQITVRDGDLE